MRQGVGWIVLAAVAATLGSAVPARADDAPGTLTVGDTARPLNVEGAPQFGWMPRTREQTAYEIKVSRDGAGVWDSGKVASSAQSYVPYAGPALDNGASYTWTVRTWDRGDQASPYAAAARFDTGLTDSGWSGAHVDPPASPPATTPPTTTRSRASSSRRRRAG